MPLSPWRKNVDATGLGLYTQERTSWGDSEIRGAVAVDKAMSLSLRLESARKEARRPDSFFIGQRELVRSTDPGIREDDHSVRVAG